MHILLSATSPRRTVSLSKIAARDLISQMFFQYPAERDFLVTSILKSLPLGDAPVIRSAEIHSDGIRITLVSSLMIRFVQLSGGLANLMVDQKMFHETSLDALEDREVQRSASVGDAAEAAAGDVLAKAMDTAASYALQIVRSVESRSSPIFVRTFCQDLLRVLCLPEWPAAELLLKALVVAMLNTAEDETASTSARKTA